MFNTLILILLVSPNYALGSLECFLDPETLDDLEEEPEVTFGGGVYLFLVLLSVFLLLFTFPITALLCIKVNCLSFYLSIYTRALKMAAKSLS